MNLIHRLAPDQTVHDQRHEAHPWREQTLLFVPVEFLVEDVNDAIFLQKALMTGSSPGVTILTAELTTS